MGKPVRSLKILAKNEAALRRTCRRLARDLVRACAGLPQGVAGSTTDKLLQIAAQLDLPVETQESPPAVEPREPAPGRRRGSADAPGSETAGGRALELLRQRGQATVAELVAASGDTRGSVDTAIHRLVAQGALERVSTGTYRLARRRRAA